MEVIVSNYFSPRRNLIVPNVSWGMFRHEVDLCVLSPAGYASEVEIKVSRSDLIKDKEKRHGHDEPMIKHLYFAIPEHLEKDIEHIPERAGILVVKWNKPWVLYGTRKIEGYWSCKKSREPRIQYNRKWTDHERNSLLRLGAMRIWNLKQKLQKALTMLSEKDL
jgi:hypothetical protein